MPRLSVRQGDITTYDGDAVVNAANNHLILGAGVAGAIRRAGGPTIQHECDRLGPIAVGEAAITGGGTLPVAFVIHAAAMGDAPVSEESIRRSTQAALQLAADHGVSRIAFPVLGSGVGGFDFERSATIMRDAILASAHLERFAEIVLYGYSTEHATLLEGVIGT